jgi:hypothetical protein
MMRGGVTPLPSRVMLPLLLPLSPVMLGVLVLLLMPVAVLSTPSRLFKERSSLMAATAPAAPGLGRRCRSRYSAPSRNMRASMLAKYCCCGPTIDPGRHNLRFNNNSNNNR